MNLDSLIAGALNSPLGKKAMAAAGFAEATKLRRGEALPSGPLALGVVGESSAVADALAAVGLSAEPALIDSPETRTKDDKGRDQALVYSS